MTNKSVSMSYVLDHFFANWRTLVLFLVTSFDSSVSRNTLK